MIDLRALREKYLEMKRLREAHAARDAGDPRPRLRALAARFPGALREIDQLPMPVIEARVVALERAIARGAPEPWMIEVARYHAWMRLALRVRRECTGDRSIARARACLAADPLEHPDDIDPSAVDDEMLLAILRPPAGRLHRAVLARVADELEVDPSEIDAHLAQPRAR